MPACNFSPVSQEMASWHQRAQIEAHQIREIAQPGDIIFRLSTVSLLGGLLDFSKEVSIATRSDFSHAVLVLEANPDGVLLVDVVESGISRRFLIDWYMDPSKNVVVKRLKPEYQYLVPKLLKEVRELIEQDCLYDDKFIRGDNKFYCTELVDHCFRKIGHPLAERVKIKDFPESKIFLRIGCLLGGIKMNKGLAIAGNDEIGLFSSPMLEMVVDFR